jgi:hypothetical protein
MTSGPLLTEATSDKKIAPFISPSYALHLARVIHRVRRLQHARIAQIRLHVQLFQGLGEAMAQGQT